MTICPYAVYRALFAEPEMTTMRQHVSKAVFPDSAKENDVAKCHWFVQFNDHNFWLAEPENENVYTPHTHKLRWRFVRVRAN